MYRSYGEGLTSDLDDHRSSVGWAESEIEAQPGLALAESTTYQWEHTVPVEDYLGLLATTSQYAIAAPATRDRLFPHLATAIGPTAHLNGRTLLLVVEPVTD